MPSLAEQYDARHGDVGIPEAQKEERMERELFKDEQLSLHRTSRNRGVVFNIPAERWDRIFGGARHGA